MPAKFSLPDFLQKELEALEKEAQQNLEQIADERKQLSRDLNMSLTKALRSQLQ